MFENIEKFYKKCHNDLYGKLRPVKSFPKNAGTVVEKFADYYKDKHKQTSTLEELRETVFAENSQDSDVENTYSRVMKALSFMEIHKDEHDSEKENYKLTDSFIDFVNNNKDLNDYICELLEGIKNLSTINGYLNLLLCILREAYLYGEVIHFPNKPEEFRKKVNDENKREEYRTRIKNIYGYTGNTEDYSPNISYVANFSTMCNDLKLMVMTDKSMSIDNMPTSVLTIKGFNILSQIDSNLSYLFSDESDETDNNEKSLPPASDDMNKFSRNLIVFGAPGTGKSYFLNEEKDGKTDDNNIIKNGLLGATYKNNFERVTFHPDYSYANFVGSYKPTMKLKKDSDDEEEIIYGFVPGPFMRILKRALINTKEPYLLVVEEINRANPAAVFGEVFQLLDRNKDGESEYYITPSEEIIKYLSSNEEDKGLNGSLIPKSKIKKLRIPSNMFIWATMNSADQGVFPMDTAFKRRWEFEYIGINDGEDIDEIKDISVIFKAGNDSQLVKWNDLRKKINDNLKSGSVNEDKLLGPFFISVNKLKEAENHPETFSKTFKSKVIMYLFEDAARQKSIREKVFAGYNADINTMTLSDLFTKFDNIGIKLFGFDKEDNKKYPYTIKNKDNREEQLENDNTPQNPSNTSEKNVNVEQSEDASN